MAVIALLYFLLTVKTLGIKPDQSCCVVTIMNKSLEMKRRGKKQISSCRMYRTFSVSIFLNVFQVWWGVVIECIH